MSEVTGWQENCVFDVGSELMKKVSNTIRIGMVRRRPPSPKPSEDQTLSNIQEETTPQTGKEQVRE